MENTPAMREWLNDFGLSHPLVIGGPCSAETEEQVMKIAHELKDTDVTVYRPGIWKPRTRPGNFEGVGAIGLKWLQKAKEETGLLTATEVANKDNVKLAKFLKQNMYGKKIVVGMGAGSISNWIKELPDLMK